MCIFVFVKLFFVDDYLFVCDGVCMWLEVVLYFEVVGEVGDVDVVLQVVCILVFDLVLMDIGMCGMNGIVFIEKFVEEFFEIVVFVFLMYDNLEYVWQVICVGVCGYVFKDVFVSELVEVIDVVLVGWLFYSVQLVMCMVEQVVMFMLVEVFMLCECDIFDGIVKGYVNKCIVDELGLFVCMVELYCLNLKCKFGIEGQVELVKFVVELGKGCQVFFVFFM